MPHEAPLDPQLARELLHEANEESHKYSRGVLGVRTGSFDYPGAAVLGVEAAWHTGIGSVRYVPAAEEAAPPFGLPTPAAAVLASRPETVISNDNAANRARCDAWLIGSGADASARSFAEREALLALLAGAAPVVVDAGALDLVASARPSAPTIITPHWGEFMTLWRSAGLGESGSGSDLASRADASARLARELGVTVLLKGSHTVAASPTGHSITYGPATPWLATAGTGDVLAGALGAILAANSNAIRENPELLVAAGATAAALHDRAARIASGEQANGDGTRSRGAPIVALNVARSLAAARLVLTR